MSRKGLTGLYANSNLVPTPDSNNFDTIFRLVGFPNSLFAKKANGVVYPISDGVGIVSIDVGKTLFVDAQFGNDLTGLPNRQDKPFATILIADSYANGGDTINVRPGNYSASYLAAGKDGVSYHFEDGAIVTGSIIFSTAGSINVTGSGTFRASSVVLNTYGTGNSIYFEAHYMESGLYCIKANAGNTKITIDVKTDMKSTHATEQVVRIDEHQKVYINCSRFIGKGGLVLSTGYDDSELIIHANSYIYSPAGTGYVGFNITNGRNEFYGDIYADGVGFYGTPVIWLDNWNSDVHTAQFFGDIYSTCTDPLIWVTLNNGSADFYGKINKVSAIIVSNGIVNFRNDIISNQVATAVIQHNGGKCIVSAFLKNLNADPSSHGVLVSGAGLILHSPTVIYITDNNAYAVFAAAAQSIKSYRTCSNKGVNINVTELVSVILVDAAVDSQ